ncbi:secretin N-terminal domain-containing protein [Pseudomonas sp. B329]|uniref:secretin N-terminal domain-containing protein n=1 Tax=Pseudomonas sp. B329 TaxID=1553459 RepID=UPI0032B70CC6|nr:type III secretion system domain protein, InvG family [Pseudomonas sp. B329]
MHTDSPNPMNCRWLHCGLLCAALLLGSRAAWGQAYQAQDESLHTFFTALSGPLGLPVVTSRAVARRRISGTFDFAAPQRVLETLAGQQDLIWHRSGQVVHLYTADEVRSSAVVLRHISVNRLRGIMRRAGLDEPRYPLRESGARTFYVYGPPSYVDHVLRLASLMDQPRRKQPEGATAFGVVQVINVAVQDRQQGEGANKVRVPGMAAMIEARLSPEQKGQLADGSLVLVAYSDTNSLLIKGQPSQVSLIEKLVAELDSATVQDDVSSGPDPLPPPPAPAQLSTAQHERVQRAFLRTDREFSP